MFRVRDEVILYGLLAGAALAGLYVWRRGVSGTAQDITAGAVGAAGGVFSGVVRGIGSAFGISPQADTQCSSFSLNCTPGAAWENQIKPAIDPTSSSNLVYSGVNDIGATIAGDQGWTLGGWIYDLTHKTQ